MKSKIVMGVRVDNLPLAEALNKAREFLHSGCQHKIFTPNPEMLVKANKDEYFRQVLNAGDLNLCDGFGLHLVSGAPRIAGVDFMLKLCQLAAERGSSIYLLGSGSDDVAGRTADELSKQFPGLKIAGYDKGPEVRECHCEEERCDDAAIYSAAVDKINAAHPDILFVAFGMGKQEKWIHENLSKLPSVKIAMGVGGAFDYISGAVKRAPCWMRQIGLEWMYRLMREPRRLGRILNATFSFIYLVLKSKITISNDKSISNK